MITVISQRDMELPATYPMLAIASLLQKLISLHKLSLLLQVELYYR